MKRRARLEDDYGLITVFVLSSFVKFNSLINLKAIATLTEL